MLKLFFCLLMTATWFNSAAQWPLSKQACIKMTNASLKEFLDIIQNNTGYEYLVEGSILESTKPVTFNCKSCSLAYLLDSAFSGQPYRYFIVGKDLVVVKKNEILFKAAITSEPGNIFIGFSSRPKILNILLDFAAIYVI